MSFSLLRGTPVDYEPVLQNRFIVEFPTDLNIEYWQVQTVTRPKIEINPVEIPFVNTSNWVAGRYKWSTIELELIQHIGPSSSQKMMDWVRLHAESQTGRMGYAFGYKKDLVLHSIDPTGVSVERWRLIQCMITNADFGSNDYGQDEVQKIKVTLQPFWCLHQN
jgi:hypothetical protein